MILTAGKSEDDDASFLRRIFDCVTTGGRSGKKTGHAQKGLCGKMGS